MTDSNAPGEPSVVGKWEPCHCGCGRLMPVFAPLTPQQEIVRSLLLAWLEEEQAEGTGR